jgi:hypothetical protein
MRRKQNLPEERQNLNQQCDPSGHGEGVGSINASDVSIIKSNIGPGLP